ncbi:MAG: hypothetical protein C5B50_17545 [Verrucomicrobia bacterium]|nr:MAG: hypothetical protein C5B50_17545 [Verrucomicrobiota bacterium]
MILVILAIVRERKFSTSKGHHQRLLNNGRFLFGFCLSLVSCFQFSNRADQQLPSAPLVIHTPADEVLEKLRTCRSEPTAQCITNAFSLISEWLHAAGYPDADVYDMFLRRFKNGAQVRFEDLRFKVGAETNYFFALVDLNNHEDFRILFDSAIFYDQLKAAQRSYQKNVWVHFFARMAGFSWQVEFHSFSPERFRLLSEKKEALQEWLMDFSANIKREQVLTKPELLEMMTEAVAPNIIVNSKAWEFLDWAHRANILGPDDTESNIRLERDNPLFAPEADLLSVYKADGFTRFEVTMEINLLSTEVESAELDLYSLPYLYFVSSRYLEELPLQWGPNQMLAAPPDIFRKKLTHQLLTQTDIGFQQSFIREIAKEMASTFDRKMKDWSSRIKAKAAQAQSSAEPVAVLNHSQTKSAHHETIATIFTTGSYDEKGFSAVANGTVELWRFERTCKLRFVFDRSLIGGSFMVFFNDRDVPNDAVSLFGYPRHRIEREGPHGVAVVDIRKQLAWVFDEKTNVKSIKMIS